MQRHKDEPVDALVTRQNDFRFAPARRRCSARCRAAAPSWRPCSRQASHPTLKYARAHLLTLSLQTWSSSILTYHPSYGPPHPPARAWARFWGCECNPFLLRCAATHVFASYWQHFAAASTPEQLQVGTPPSLNRLRSCSSSACSS